MSFRQKLLLLFAATILFCVAVMSVSVYSTMRHSFEQANQDRANAVAAEFRSEFQRRGQEIARKVESIAASDSVQRIALDSEAAVGGRWDLQLLVGVVEEGDVLAQRGTAVHRCAQGRTGAVGTDQGVEADVVRAVVAVIDETRVTGVEINGVQAPMEVHGGAGLLGQFQQRGVQIAAVDRPDHFAVVAAVAQQFRMAVQMMDHAAAHHHGDCADPFLQSRHSQTVPPTFGECEVDRTPADEAVLARIGSTLEYVD